MTAVLQFVPVARERAAQTGQSIWTCLLESSGMAAPELASEFGREAGLLVLGPQALLQVQADFSVLDYPEVFERRWAAVHHEGRPALLLTDPFDDGARAWAYRHCPAFTETLSWALPEHFADWLALYEDQLTALSMASPEPAQSASEATLNELSLAQVGAESNTIVRFVGSTLLDALKSGASDIHLESDARGLAVKFRLDGVLAAVSRLEGVSNAEQVISRLKVLSELDIAERRIPQDGRLTVTYQKRSIDVRVSIMPSVHGEDVVMRILDRQHLAQSLEGLTLAKLGFDHDTIDRFKRLCARPYGMVLVTGPTGSGKTTSLYAVLTETRDPKEKVITIEDPVEYELSGMLQIPVNEKKGLTFARGLRSILRHDPDRILVGEIRDQETALIAVQSALTGHLVYTTVHANTAFDVLSRFAQLGVDPYDLSAALNGVLAQRLVRLACPHCRRPVAGPPTSNPMQGEWIGTIGCAACRGTGYRGRRAIGELLVLTPELKSALAQRAPQHELLRLASLEGMVTLRDQALALAACAQTTLAEVDRVTLAA